MQLVVDSQITGARGRRHRVDANEHASKKRYKELVGSGRQLQPGVVTPRFGLPTLLGQEQSLAAAKAQRMSYPDRAVAHRPSQSEQGGNLQRPEGALAVRVGDGCAPGGSQSWGREFAGKSLDASGVPGSKLVQGIECRVLAGGLPRQPAHACQQRTHRRNGIDQALPDSRRPTRRAPGALGRDDLAQAGAQFGIWHAGVMGCELGELLQQLLVLLRPIDGRDAVGTVAPQVGHAALEHEDDLVGRREQAVAQEATELERARRLLDPGTDPWGRPAIRRA
jgi:hypothetical protein